MAPSRCRRETDEPAFEKIRSNPRARDNPARQHRLLGNLGTGVVKGQALECWQFEVTGSGRIWYLVDDTNRVVWITHASTGHPKATDYLDQHGIRGRGGRRVVRRIAGSTEDVPNAIAEQADSQLFSRVPNSMDDLPHTRGLWLIHSSGGSNGGGVEIELMAWKPGPVRLSGTPIPVWAGNRMTGFRDSIRV